MKKKLQIFILIISIVGLSLIFCLNNSNEKQHNNENNYNDCLLKITALENEILYLEQFHEIITELVTLYHSTDGTKIKEIQYSVKQLNKLNSILISLNEINSDYSSLEDTIDSLSDWQKDILSYNEKVALGETSALVSSFQDSIIATNNTIFEYRKSIIKNYISIAEKK